MLSESTRIVELFTFFHVARTNQIILVFFFSSYSVVKRLRIIFEQRSISRISITKISSSNQAPFASYPYSSYRTNDLNFYFLARASIDGNHREALVSSSFEAIPTCLFLRREKGGAQPNNLGSTWLVREQEKRVNRSATRLHLLIIGRV